MTDDATLLHRYVAAHDEAAFAEMIRAGVKENEVSIVDLEPQEWPITR